MDHQWNYVLGLPDPRDPIGVRGLAAFNFNSIWVNAEGRRFTQEFGDPKINLGALLRQAGATYWSVFDENGKRGFSVTLAGWENFNEVSKLVYDTEPVTLKTDSINELAIKMGVPKETLRTTIERYNHLTVEGTDRDFQAFSAKTTPKPKKIETAPFYAAQFFPITRKSMGGVSVDLQCRVLDSKAKPIPGLYAVGEVTGFGGINGKAALEGTFLGPAIFMGRIAGKAVGKSPESKPVMLRELSPPSAKRPFVDQQCLRCHTVAQDIKKNHPGYWHYEQSHAKVLSRNYNCSKCHSELYPYQKAAHKMKRLALTYHCIVCHGVPLATSPAL
jgi:succinate dehydrogenase/fumarate reductase flavoprotein subunit